LLAWFPFSKGEGAVSMKVIRSVELKKWLRRDHWFGYQAAHILSDLIPEWTDYEGTELLEGRIVRCQSFCKRTDDEYSVFVRGRDEFEVVINRFENSIDEKIDVMRQSFEVGEKAYITPNKWINWAIEKNFKINWLAFALDEGFFSKVKKGIETEETLRKIYFHNDQVESIPENLPQQKVEPSKPLGSRERNNLLKVIAALCKEQDLNLEMPYKAATIVENQIKSIGLSLGNDTIASILSDAEKITKSAKKS
jgi:hypothetical protein